MVKMEYRNIDEVAKLERNPRKISKKELQGLIKSIEQLPDYFEAHPIVLSDRTGKLVVIDGNQRLEAAKRLGLKQVPTVLMTGLSEERERKVILLANKSAGVWDYEMLANEWDLQLLEDCNIEIPNVSIDVDVEEPEREEKIDDEGEEVEDKSFEDMMIKDCLFESDNDFEIPNLLLKEQAGKLELPLNTWGANSRLSKDVMTYHFYVDDYRFNALWKDPTKLLASGCKAIVEPNCSLHDQTPISYGLHQIYKKRWLARYCQECGIKVYADLNVSHKFIEYNKMGIPKGYNAFMTRGLDGWMESLKSDLEVAREISGLETPNLIVYGGGKEIKKFCQQNNLLYITDFINAKKGK